jgi:uncharacterized protein
VTLVVTDPTQNRDDRWASGAGLGPVVPQFFGDPSGPLFGVYHAPVTAAPRGAGVVLCYPGPQEYRQAHWAYHKLATMLARAGLHVLRFDYFGTGDSAGASGDATLARWTTDVRTAAAELQDIAGVRRAAVVGMRLGGALAIRACVAGLTTSDLVLWDPVVSGRAYLAQLEAIQRRQLRALHYPASVERRVDELLGYRLTPNLRDAIAGVDLLREPLGAPKRVTMICTAEQAEFAALRDRFWSQSVPCDLQYVSDPSLAVAYHWRADTLLAHAAPSSIVAHLAGRAT